MVMVRRQTGRSSLTEARLSVVGIIGEGYANRIILDRLLPFSNLLQSEERFGLPRNQHTRVESLRDEPLGSMQVRPPLRERVKRRKASSRLTGIANSQSLLTRAFSPEPSQS